MEPLRLMALWGKLPRGADAPPSYHPLLCHMIDVALVAQAMWAAVLSRSIRGRVAEALGVSEDAAERWVGFLAGLHDLGKASPVFVYQVPRGEAISGRAWPIVRGLARIPHGTITAYALPATLTEPPFNLPPKIARRIGALLGGHHGIFPRAEAVGELTHKWNAVGKGEWTRGRKVLVHMLADLLGVTGLAAPRQLDNTTAMYLAGLVSVADWIGSNTTFFPFAVENVDTDAPPMPADYREAARTKADEALTMLGWTGWKPHDNRRHFSDLFGFAPNSLQDEIVDLAEQLREPSLVIIEAPMGEGKTEAAFYLADTWSTTIGQRGSYVALPTQATSNQMFSRARTFLAKRYPADILNLQLLHGHAALSAEFQVLRREGDRLFKLGEVYGEDGHDGARPNVVAAEWFTARKRGLLAPFGVGTVDQTLLGVLQTKHVFVRLFGLAHKTVVVDEVHAYDTYMTTLLERLLEWLGALGTSVVLLSATLPKLRREALTRAYLRGLEAPDADTRRLQGVDYPRVTWASSAQTGVRTVATSPLATKRVVLRWVDGRLPDRADGHFAPGTELQRVLAQGGCAAVICNTVRRAQEVYQALRPYFPDLADDGEPELEIFHARYRFQERQKREQRALIRFGKKESKVQVGEHEFRCVHRPFRAVIVATQVIEQSLDLDFDLMVSDLAPVDLVLQRTGRLHRHDRARPSGLEQPTLWLCAPNIDDEDVPQFPRGDEQVYDRHILLRSWLTLKGQGKAIEVPADVERLVEAVYSDDVDPGNVPQAFQQRWSTTLDELHQELKSDQAKAKQTVVAAPFYPGDIFQIFNRDLDEDDPSLHRNLRAQTRLAEPTVSVVLLRHDEAALGQQGPKEIDQVRQLLERSVTINHPGLVRAITAGATEAEPPPAWHQQALLRHTWRVVLEPDGSRRIGSYELRLDDDLGVTVTRLG